jgi:hypothetical protein
MKKIFVFILFLTGICGSLSAQDSTQKKSAASNGTAQEPVKQEDKKAPKAEAKPAASSKSDAGGGTQKMAITEQGVDKTKKKKKAQATTSTTTTPSPAPPAKTK